ncbi:hypothetical protein AVEN_279-1 [Araneus ventricosus]|uniref:Mos1 transposase HTH domain-containing protein n=1 Tax=Araneus ventricosus TaxID=182803 RepID=A0A4Y2CPG8_ARAVE|nr:hypothetical protein AVEN_279-1 [Araneus ventricosus]
MCSECKFPLILTSFSLFAGLGIGGGGAEELERNLHRLTCHRHRLFSHHHIRCPALARSAELYEVHEPVHPKEIQSQQRIRNKILFEKPQACKNMIRCGLFCSTFWADLKTLRIIRESQTFDMPTKEASGARAATSACVVSRHPLGTTVLSCSCVGNLYGLFCVFKLIKIIESPAPCEVRSVIRFLSARNLSAADIHWQICEVYGATAMCEGKMRKWFKDFKAGRDNGHDDSRSGSPSVIGLFWLGSFGPPTTAPTLRPAIFIFSAISNIISAATTTTMTKT